MRTHIAFTGLLFGALVLTPAGVRAADPAPQSVAPETPKFDMTLKQSDVDTKLYRIERAGPARDFINHAAIYIRFIPVKEGGKVFPVFIQERNYLTCPKNDKRWLLNDVKQVDADRRRGIKMFGFFFDRPECDDPTFHFSPVTS